MELLEVVAAINTGSGGGGGGYDGGFGNGGAGGKGVVILSMPSCKFFRNNNRCSCRIYIRK
jgi:hypothetical protein